MYEKALWVLKKTCNEDNYLWKEENDTLNKLTAGTVWKHKDLLHLQRKFLQKYTSDKNYVKLYG